ncbi:MAG: endonuclease domain-containing protein [Stygiobacter sp.]|uniref:Endonuclease domain-containing protein n=1 Tax=Stygiobacter electus TaxID=3032292 RepID=A0AAE3NYF2_9BACT|nr:endonuclease domain-containing protein [Stygiobacter electus]MDF1613256.1 endonuclease domain-containing protein [Stygiobacter electus]
MIAKTFCRQLRKNSTQAENIFWERVRSRKFLKKKFYRQYPIFYDLFGLESFFIADFYCHEEKIIIELDGEIHKYKLKDDEKRTEILNQLGLKVIRFRNEEITKDLSDVLEKLKQYI